MFIKVGFLHVRRHVIVGEFGYTPVLKIGPRGLSRGIHTLPGGLIIVYDCTWRADSAEDGMLPTSNMSEMVGFGCRTSICNQGVYFRSYAGLGVC